MSENESSANDMSLSGLAADVVADLKQKHGPNLRFKLAPDDSGAVVVFKKATSAAWNMFVNDLANDKKEKATTIRNLALNCTVHPSRADAMRIFDEYPGIPMAMADEIGTLCGAGGGAAKL